MIVTLIGNNSFAMQRRLNELIEEFAGKHDLLAVEKFDGQEIELQAILDAVQSLPFLAKRKMVVIRNGSSNKEMTEQIEQIISSIGETTDVIFYETQIDRRTAYFKVLKNETQLEEFNELDARGLANWLSKEAKNRLGALSFSDANYLIERLGANQTLLNNELDKLLTYSPEITRDTIDLLTEPNPQSKVFDLLDAAFTGQKQKALKLYEDQRAQKVEPRAILAMIGWQLNVIAIAKYSEGQDISEVGRESGIKDYPLRKARKLADKLSDKDLKKMISEALDIDWRGKTAALDMDEALKTYIVGLGS